MKHTGTSYNAGQRIEAAITALRRDERDWLIIEHDVQQGLHLDAQVKRRRTMTAKRVRTSRQRLSLACTYWLQHNPLKPVQTFEQWLEQNKKYTQPQDMDAWLHAAWTAALNQKD